MTSKLPWATAAAIIVIAAVGAWALWPAAKPVTQPPAPGPATITAILGPGMVFAAYPENNGIENIYIIKTNQDNEQNFSGLTENMLGLIYENAGEDDITYDTKFAICVAVTGHIENMGALSLDYLKVSLGGYTSSADWTITHENSDDTAVADAYQFYTDGTTWIRANVIWDNNGNYYQLDADDNLILDNVHFWLKGPV